MSQPNERDGFEHVRLRHTGGMANERSYTVVIERGDDSGFVAVCSALGAVSQGATRDEAIANVREAMLLAVEDYVENGEPLPVDTGATTEQISIAV